MDGETRRRFPGDGFPAVVAGGNLDIHAPGPPADLIFKLGVGDLHPALFDRQAELLGFCQPRPVRRFLSSPRSGRLRRPGNLAL